VGFKGVNLLEEAMKRAFEKASISQPLRESCTSLEAFVFLEVIQ